MDAIGSTIASLIAAGHPLQASHLLSVSHYISPSKLPQHLLVKLWTLVKDDVLAVVSYRLVVTYQKKVSIVRKGFQTVLEVFQLGKQEVRNLHSSWSLLKKLRQINEDEWNACLTALLHQFVTLYLTSGPTVLENQPTKSLLQLFSRPPLAKVFLDSITICPEVHGYSTKSVLVAALQIFEQAYRKYPMIILSCCLSKLVNGHSDAVILRLECLSLAARIHSSKRATDGGGQLTPVTWPYGAIKCLRTSILYDSSVRVRRSALHVLLLACPDDRELLGILLLKIRDHDEKVRTLSFQRLLKIPMEVLVANAKSDDWRVIFEQGLSDERKGTYRLAEAFLVKYLTTDSICAPPSFRLKELNLLKCRNYEMYRKLIEKHINVIFETESSYRFKS